MAVCTVIGTVWYIIFKNVFKTLQTKSPSHWIVNVEQPVKKENHQNSYALTVSRCCALTRLIANIAQNKRYSFFFFFYLGGIKSKRRKKNKKPVYHNLLIY